MGLRRVLRQTLRTARRVLPRAVRPPNPLLAGHVVGLVRVAAVRVQTGRAAGRHTFAVVGVPVAGLVLVVPIVVGAVLVPPEGPRDTRAETMGAGRVTRLPRQERPALLLPVEVRPRRGLDAFQAVARIAVILAGQVRRPTIATETRGDGLGLRTQAPGGLALKTALPVLPDVDVPGLRTHDHGADGVARPTPALAHATPADAKVEAGEGAKSPGVAARPFRAVGLPILDEALDLVVVDLGRAVAPVDGLATETHKETVLAAPHGIVPVARPVLALPTDGITLDALAPAWTKAATQARLRDSSADGRVPPMTVGPTGTVRPFAKADAGVASAGAAPTEVTKSLHVARVVTRTPAAADGLPRPAIHASSRTDPTVVLVRPAGLASATVVPSPRVVRSHGGDDRDGVGVVEGTVARHQDETTVQGTATDVPVAVALHLRTDPGAGVLPVPGAGVADHVVGSRMDPARVGPKDDVLHAANGVVATVVVPTVARQGVPPEATDHVHTPSRLVGASTSDALHAAKAHLVPMAVVPTDQAKAKVGATARPPRGPRREGPAVHIPPAAGQGADQGQVGRLVAPTVPDAWNIQARHGADPAPARPVRLRVLAAVAAPRVALVVPDATPIVGGHPAKKADVAPTRAAILIEVRRLAPNGVLGIVAGEVRPVRPTETGVVANTPPTGRRPLAGDP